MTSLEHHTVKRGSFQSWSVSPIPLLSTMKSTVSTCHSRHSEKVSYRKCPATSCVTVHVGQILKPRPSPGAERKWTFITAAEHEYERMDLREADVIFNNRSTRRAPGYANALGYHLFRLTPGLFAKGGRLPAVPQWPGQAGEGTTQEAVCHPEPGSLLATLHWLTC